MRCLFCNKGVYKDYATINKRPLIKCSYCGLIKLNKIPDDKKTKEVIKLIEKSFYFEYEKERRSYQNYFIEKLNDIQKYSSQKILLDVGCSTGIFLSEAEKRGYFCEGCDYSRKAVDICINKGLRAFYCNADNLDRINKKYNIISAFQTIEHLRKPLNFIININNHLTKNGIFLLTTPDVDGFVSKISGKKWFGYYNKEHYYYFSKKSLYLALKSNGFKVIINRCEPGRKLSVNYISERLNKYYYKKNESLQLLFNTIKILFFPFLNFHFIKEPNVNIYIIAKKIRNI